MITRDFPTASALLEFLNPLSTDWYPNQLFRSQFEDTDEGYKLTPSLFRPMNDGSFLKKYYDLAFDTLNSTGPRDTIIKFGQLYSFPDFREAITISFMEQLVLKHFVEKANYLGIPIPESERMLNDELNTRDFIFNNPYKLNLRSEDQITYSLPTNIRSIFSNHLKTINSDRPPLFAGLAQHHGAITRLLDFTFNPYKSLFHVTNLGGSQNNFESPTTGFISIYWFSDTYFKKSYLDTVTSGMQYSDNYIPSAYQLVKMPSSSNHYLHQQEGLFAYPVFPYDFKLLNRRFPSVNDFLATFGSDDNDPLKRARIPVSELSNLKTLLVKFGITKSRMMPNLDNIVAEMKDL